MMAKPNLDKKGGGNKKKRVSSAKKRDPYGKKAKSRRFHCEAGRPSKFPPSRKTTADNKATQSPRGGAQKKQMAYFKTQEKKTLTAPKKKTNRNQTLKNRKKALLERKHLKRKPGAAVRSV